MVKIPVVVGRRVWRRGKLVRETAVLTERHAFSAVFKKQKKIRIIEYMYVYPVHLKWAQAGLAIPRSALQRDRRADCSCV